jgi:hypothetical protein
MGELIKNIGIVRIGDNNLTVELNEGNDEHTKIVHIQNENVRFELTSQDYEILVASILEAAHKLRNYKSEQK